MPNKKGNAYSDPRFCRLWERLQRELAGVLSEADNSTHPTLFAEKAKAASRTLVELSEIDWVYVPRVTEWVITGVGNFMHSLLPDVGTVGPATATMSKAEIEAHPLSVEFRMHDDDDIVYYIGRMVVGTHDDMLAPLDQFGEPNAGCSGIAYRDETGSWR
jgi:hypothetical protein